MVACFHLGRKAALPHKTRPCSSPHQQPTNVSPSACCQDRLHDLRRQQRQLQEAAEIPPVDLLGRGHLGDGGVAPLARHLRGELDGYPFFIWRRENSDAHPGDV